jgi:Fe-S-cluster-containing hydrogenase component 2
MLAHYGFEDGTGVFYISIDTGKCSHCMEKGCADGCPGGLFEFERDDDDSDVAIIKAKERNVLNIVCAECKPLDKRPALLPCQTACGLEAITHSW